MLECSSGALIFTNKSLLYTLILLMLLEDVVHKPLVSIVHAQIHSYLQTSLMKIRHLA